MSVAFASAFETIEEWAAATVVKGCGTVDTDAGDSQNSKQHL